MLKDIINNYITKLSTHQFAGRLGRGIFWSVLGSGLSQGLLLLSTIPVSRFLGPVAYGQLGLLQSTLAAFTIFAGPTLGLTSQKYVAELRHTDKQRTARIIRLTLFVTFMLAALLCLTLYFSAPLLAAKAFNNQQLVTGLQITSLTLLFNGYNGAQTGIIAGFEDFKAVAIINAIKGIIAFPTMIWFSYLGGFNGTVWALALNAAVGCLLASYFIRKQKKNLNIHVSIKAAFSEHKILHSYSLPAFIAGVSSITVTWFSNALLVNQKNGYYEMGLFNIANQWRTVILFLPALINQPFLSILANFYGNSDQHNFRKTFRWNLILTSTAAVLPAVFVLLMPEFIVDRYDPSFAESKGVLILLVLSAVLTTISSVAGNAISSMGRMWLASSLNISWCLIFLTCIFLVTPLHAYNLSMAYCISYGIYTGIVFAYGLYVLHYKMNSKHELIRKR